jgi:hypothetical protein
MNFAIGNIYSANLVGKTRAMGHGTSDTSKGTLYPGVREWFRDNFTSDVGVNVAMIINAVEGNQYADWPRNECVYIKAPNFIIQNTDDYAVYTQYVRNYTSNPFLCDVDAVKNMIVSYNRNASFAAVKNYVETMSLDIVRSK